MKRCLPVFLKGMLICSILLSTFGNIPGAGAAPGELDQNVIDNSGPNQQTGELQILEVTPRGGFLKERNTDITVVFNQPMDRKSTEESFSIQPDLPHEYSWSDPSTLQIQFSDLFEPGTQYAVTLASSAAKTADGKILTEDYRWYYWLDPFTIDVTTPGESQIHLKFNTDINPKKSLIPFEISPPLEGSWKWGIDNAVYFMTTAPIPKAQEFTIRLTGPLYDEYGEIAYTGPTLKFTAPPPIRSIMPKEGDSVQADQEFIKIVFTEPVNKLSAENAFHISPPIGGWFSWGRSAANSTFEDELTFSPNALFDQGKSYTISILPSLKDPAGRPLMLS